MKTSPLTGTRYPESSDSTNLAQFFQNMAWDFDDNGVPRFANTASRDTAYSNWVAAGNAMTEGLYCHLNGVGLQVYSGGAWRTVRQGYLADALSTASGTVNLVTYQTIHSITVTIPAGLYTGQRIKVYGRCFLASPSGVGTGIQILGGPERPVAQSMTADITTQYYDTNLAAGSRTYNLQVHSTVSAQDVTWRSPYLAVEVV